MRVDELKLPGGGQEGRIMVRSSRNRKGARQGHNSKSVETNSGVKARHGQLLQRSLRRDADR